MQVRQLYTDKCSLVIGAALAATPADARIRELMTQGRPAYSELITSVTSRPGRNLRPGQLSSMASGATSEGQSRLCLPDVLVFYRPRGKEGCRWMGQLRTLESTLID
jgi:hypothetical protein